VTEFNHAVDIVTSDVWCCSGRRVFGRARSERDFRLRRTPLFSSRQSGQNIADVRAAVKYGLCSSSWQNRIGGEIHTYLLSSLPCSKPTRLQFRGDFASRPGAEFASITAARKEEGRDDAASIGWFAVSMRCFDRQGRNFPFDSDTLSRSRCCLWRFPTLRTLFFHLQR
jgi:hypothetical protein